MRVFGYNSNVLFLGVCFFWRFIDRFFYGFVWFKIESIDTSPRSLYEEWCWYHLQSGVQKTSQKKQGPSSLNLYCWNNLSETRLFFGH